jgi:RND superfamily putative drug exporter
VLFAIARFCVRHRLFVTVFWVAALVASGVLANRLGARYENDFRLPASESREAFEVLQSEFPDQSGDTIRVVFRSDSSIFDPEIKAAIEELMAEVRNQPHVSSVRTPYDPGAVVSGDQRVALVTVNLAEPAINLPREDLAHLRDTLLGANRSGLQVEAAGNAIGLADMPEFGRSEIVGLLVAVVVLLVAFGSAVAMGLPIVTAVLTLAIAMSVIASFSHAISIPMFAPDLARMIGLGVGIDYALLVVTRFRQNLHGGIEPKEAAVLAIGTAGRSVLFAGLIVAISLAGLVTMGLSFVNGLAVAAATSVILAIATSLTILPVVLATLGHKVDALRIPVFSRDESEFRKSWSYRWSRAVQRRPWITAIAAAAALVFLAVPTFSINLGASDEGNQPKTKTQRRAYDIVSEAFGPGFNGSLLVVAQLESPVGDGVGLGGSPEEQGKGTDLGAAAGGGSTSGQQADMPGNPEEAASALSSTGRAPDAGGAAARPAGLPLPPAVATLVERLSQAENVQRVSPPIPSSSGKAFLLQVIPGTSPQDERTTDLIHHIRKNLAPELREQGLDIKVAGVTALFVDLSDYLGSRLPWLIGGVVALSFLLLMVVFRSLLVPLKAAIMNVLSIGAAYGVVVAIFQWGWLKGLFGIERTGPIEPFIPMMMFAILFGLSMDYEVFLISRIREEFDKTGDPHGSVSDGLAATARVISSAAAIMIAVFLSFSLNDNRIIKLFGVGLATAVLVDATIVRLALVPSTMELLGRANWWLPGFLARILPSISIESPENHVEEIGDRDTLEEKASEKPEGEGDSHRRQSGKLHKEGPAEADRGSEPNPEATGDGSAAEADARPDAIEAR